MKTKVLLFSLLKDKVGASEVSLELPENALVSDIIDQLVDAYPTVGPIRNVLKVAVNQHFVELEDSIAVGAEIAIFPPVSGG